MATVLLFGEQRKVRLTHNVISELIKINKSSYLDVMKLAKADPFAWMRDITYSSLKIYQPDILGEMTLYDIGDELSKLEAEDSQKYLKELFDDFVQTTGLKKKVTPKKKGK